jgi:uncharacterized RDD family membrane protein YckC/RNA polymerase subunit RPABC4/transcription elongation factor Spt4
MTTQSSLCGRCGFQAEAGTKFCPNCGGPMAAAPLAASAAASSGPVGSTPPPPPFQVATVLCGQCGTEFSGGTKFCPNCGAAAGSVRAPRPEPAPAQRMAAPFVCTRCGSQVAAGTNFCPSCGNSAGPVSIAVNQSAYAGLGVRFLADLLDTIVVAVTFFLFSVTGPLDIGITFAIICLYGALTESSAQQASLGKRALGLKVTDLQGKRLRFGKAFGRWVVKQALVLIPIIGWIGLLAIGFTDKKQGVHDMMVGTLVWRKS